MAPEKGLRNLFLRSRFLSSIWLQVLLLLLFSGIAASQTSVTKLPGFDGDLPFTLETGYVGVGESNESQLFYYFVESQRNPSEDPLMLWLTGGPGCSVLSAFFYESGPLSFTYVDYNGSLPSLHHNPYTWTLWLIQHPEYLENILYIGGDSYSGIPLPIMVQQIFNDNLAEPSCQNASPRSSQEYLKAKEKISPRQLGRQ